MSVVFRHHESKGDTLVVGLFNNGKVDAEIWELGLSIGYRRLHRYVTFQQQFDAITIKPGGFELDLHYRLPPVEDPLYGDLSRIGTDLMKTFILTPNGRILRRIRWGDRDWLRGELDKRLRHWKTKTFLAVVPQTEE